MGKRETQRWLKLIQRIPLIKKPELLNDILEETEELIKIFVKNIKTAVRQAQGLERSRRAEKKQKYSFKDRHWFFFDVKII
jgi:hypothetical protein